MEKWLFIVAAAGCSSIQPVMEVTEAATAVLYIEMPEELVLVEVDEPALTDDLALALARVCVSESGWEGDRDCAGIWQIVRNVRSPSCRDPHTMQCDGRGETYLSALRRLSKHVTGTVPPVRERMRWTSTLQPSGRPPTAWVECDSPHSPVGCTGSWGLYRQRWDERQELASALVSGTLRMRPCPRDVLAWGGTMDRDFARRRGLVPVSCGETDNEFWRRP